MARKEKVSYNDAGGNKYCKFHGTTGWIARFSKPAGNSGAWEENLSKNVLSCDVNKARNPTRRISCVHRQDGEAGEQFREEQEAWAES
jgi:hypothetical protein